MKLNDAFSEASIVLIGINFSNQLDMTVGQHLNLNIKDRLGNYSIKPNVKNKTNIFLATLSRELISKDENYSIKITYQIQAHIKSDVDSLDFDQLVRTVEENKAQFVSFAPNDMSLLSASIMKWSSMIPLITPPQLIDDDDTAK